METERLLAVIPTRHGFKGATNIPQLPCDVSSSSQTKGPGPQHGALGAAPLLGQVLGGAASGFLSGPLRTRLFTEARQ